jgi:hypothetical protein
MDVMLLDARELFNLSELFMLAHNLHSLDLTTFVFHSNFDWSSFIHLRHLRFIHNMEVEFQCQFPASLTTLVFTATARTGKEIELLIQIMKDNFSLNSVECIHNAKRHVYEHKGLSHLRTVFTT